MRRRSDQHVAAQLVARDHRRHDGHAVGLEPSRVILMLFLFEMDMTTARRFRALAGLSLGETFAFNMVPGLPLHDPFARWLFAG
jgi:hypothetical protein